MLNLIGSHFSAFAVSNVTIHELKDEHGLFIQYHADTFLKGTECGYAQDYVTYLVEEGGKIKLLREYLNVIATARVLLPNGLADVPEPKS